MSVADHKDDILSCFKIAIQNAWLGGTSGKVGDNTRALYVAIEEGNDWWANKCVLQGWAFDKEAFERLPFGIDCLTYGIYEIFPRPNAK